MSVLMSLAMFPTDTKGSKSKEVSQILEIIKNSGLDLQIEDKITSKGFTKYYSEMGLGAAVVLPEAFSGLKKS